MEQKVSLISNVRQLISSSEELQPHSVVLQTLSALTGAIESVLNVWFLGVIINVIISQKHHSGVIISVIIAFIFGLLLLKLVNTFLEAKAQYYASSVNTRAQTMLSTKLVNVSYSTFLDSSFRGLYSAVKTGLEFTGGFQQFLSTTINSMVSFVSTLLLASSSLVVVFGAKSTEITKLAKITNSPLYVLVVFLLLVIPLLSANFFAKKAGKVMQEFFAYNMQLNRRMSYYLDFAFKNIHLNKILRLFDQKYTFVKNAEQEIMDGMKEDTRLQMKSSCLMGASEVITYMIIGLLYLFVGLKALAGATQIGTAVACVGTLQLLIYSLGDFFAAIGNREASFTTMEQYQKFMEYPDAEETNKKQNLLDLKDEIEFKHVSYYYPGQDKEAISDVSFLIKSGEKLAVVGRNGGGKSTMIKLLTRMIKPTSGKIMIGGIDIWEMDLAEYQRKFSVVSQDFFLLAESLAQSVSLKEDYDENRLNLALEKSGIKKRVESLKDGVSTPISKRLSAAGVDFSGGEIQKIAIARAVYRDASIFILDEPTAALDPVAEADIFNRFLEITAQHTTIFISHRMSSTRSSDRILVFDAGKIVEEGSHDKLMSEGGLYKELYSAQARFFE